MGKLLFSEAEKACLDIGTISIDHNFADRNPNIANAKTVILVQHDGDPSFDFPSEIRAVTSHLQIELERYLRLERDIGSGAIARAILKKLYDVLVINICVPRGLIDENRTTNVGVPMSYNGKRHKEIAAINTSKNLHSLTQKILRKLLQCLKPLFMIDMHTMASHSPKVTPRVPVISDSDSLSAYVEAWNIPGKKRPLQILHSFKKKNGKPAIANGSEIFAQVLQRSFAEQKIETSFDEPYELEDGTHMSQEYLSLSKAKYAVAMDVPKGLVTRENGSTLIEDLTPDRKKVDLIAACVIDAMHAVQINVLREGKLEFFS